MDGSFHDWLGSGEKLTLLVMIDDATSQIQALHLCQQESTDSYLFMMKNYLLKHGKPQILYVDKHAVFSVNRDDTSSKNFMTSFHQAMTDLDIELILASTPQAKGRVERVNRALQDRLVKELKLHNIKTMEQANMYLPTYIKEHNQLFALAPAQEEDFHQELTPKELHALEQTLAKRAYRSVSKNLTVDFMGTTYQLLESSRINRLRNQGVQCRLQLDGSVAILDQEGRLLDDRVARVKKKAPPMMSKKSLQQRQHKQDRAIDNFLRSSNQRSA